MKIEPNIEKRNELFKLFKSKKYSELDIELLKLQKEFPKSIFLLILHGNVSNELKDYKKAINSFKKIIQLNSNFADAHYNLGIIYKNLGQLENAINYYNNCINI